MSSMRTLASPSAESREVSHGGELTEALSLRTMGGDVMGYDKRP